MATDIDAFVRELKAFDDRRAVVKAMRRKINKPLPELRKRIRQHAVDILPSRGGLGAWAAAANISSSIRYASSRTAGVKLRGSRKSQGDKSDLKKLDAGTVRHPSWGRRSRGSWHSQAVEPGWFTTPATDEKDWFAVCDQAVDEAFDEIRRG